MQRKHRIINYIWINKEKAEEDGSSGPTNPMPNKYTDNVAKIAGIYNQDEIRLWVDDTLLSESQRNFLRGTSERKPNLTINDLNEIPAYKNEDLFRKVEREPHDEYDPIWQKVDYARVVVLEHLLETSDADEVFYLDLDIIDPRLDSPPVQNILDKHSMVFAKCDRNGRNEVAYLENQFMGFRNGVSAKEFVSQVLMPTVRSDIEEGRHGWRPFCRCVRERFSGVDSSLNSVTIKTTELGGPNSMGDTKVGTQGIFYNKLSGLKTSGTLNIDFPYIYQISDLDHS